MPTEGISLDMDHEKTSVMGYRTHVEVSGIHHSNTGLQIAQDMCINGYFMLLFDLAPEGGGRRRLIRHSLRMAITGSYCNLANH